MAIVLDNGVTVPDIPADVLAQFPKVVVFYNANTNMSVLLASEGDLAYVDGYLIGDSGTFYIGSLTAGKMYLHEKDDAVWGFGSDTQAMQTMLPVTMMEPLVWANHDIYKIKSIDLGTGSYTTDGIYYLDSTVEFEEEYKAPGTWFKQLADITRNKIGAVRRFTKDEMVTVLNMLPIGIRSPITAAGFTSANDGKGTYFRNMLDMSFNIVSPGNNYVVTWDGIEYKTQAVYLEDRVTMLGNGALAVGYEGDDTGEPFCIVCMSTGTAGSTALYSSETDVSHTFAIASLID